MNRRLQPFDPPPIRNPAMEPPWRPGLRVAAGLVLCGLAASLADTACAAPAQVIHQLTSAYHNIRVIEEGDTRTLCFDDAWESSISLKDPWRGHFEYTEYFHMPWLWNTNITRVLMIGLGGGSTQRSFEHYYTNLTVETVEIDPAVLQVARDYFAFEESPRQKVFIEDGRMFLRRSTSKYDLIIIDAYVQGRYGSSMPQHLATQEFFELARDHLTANGIVADNVIGSLSAWRSDIVGAVYRTLKAVFPQAYLFPAKTSQNVVILATRAGVLPAMYGLRERADLLVFSHRVGLPGFRQRLDRMIYAAPASAASSPVLTDDFAPVEGLSERGGLLNGPTQQ